MGFTCVDASTFTVGESALAGQTACTGSANLTAGTSFGASTAVGGIRTLNLNFATVGDVTVAVGITVDAGQNLAAFCTAGYASFARVDTNSAAVGESALAGETACTGRTNLAACTSFAASAAVTRV